MGNSEAPATEASEQEYTVFCRQADGRGTIWIGGVSAASPDEAAELGRQDCMEDWSESDQNRVHVLGIARGAVEILEWDDECCLVSGELAGVNCG